MSIGMKSTSCVILYFDLHLSCKFWPRRNLIYHWYEVMFLAKASLKKCSVSLITDLTLYISMIMKRFLIQNYKKIKNSGWIDVDNLTAFVGKNESGKSSIFEAFERFNDTSKYNQNVEYPRELLKNNTINDSPVCSIEFIIDGDDIPENISSELGDKKIITIKKNYENKYEVEYDGKEIITLTSNTYKAYLDDYMLLIGEINAPTVPEIEMVDDMKSRLINLIDIELSNISENMDSNTIIKKIVTLHANIQNNCGGVNVFNALMDQVHNTGKTIGKYSSYKLAKKWIIKNMPQFIYIKSYQLLELPIDTSQYIVKKLANENSNQMYTTRCLFDYIDVNVDTLQGQSPDQPDTNEYRRRTIEIANEKLTKNFNEWWKQKKYNFHCNIDNNLFTLDISDENDSSQINLSSRSLGFQYFFAFFIIFSSEKNNTHKNSILLLDEPGTHFHGKAQQESVKFLRNLAKSNQLMYTTHSTFMIDMDKPKEVKIVYEDKNTKDTKISTDIWNADSDSLLPIQTSLLHTFSHILFTDRVVIIVEGPTDVQLLRSISEYLRQKGGKSLHDNISIIPSHGAKNMITTVQLLKSKNAKVIPILDSDDLGKYAESKIKSLDITPIMIENNMPNATIEDLFEKKEYLEAVKKIYPKCKISDNELSKSNSQIIHHVRDSDKSIEKWKITEHLSKSCGKLSEYCLQNFENLIESINSAIDTHTEPAKSKQNSSITNALLPSS